MENERWIPVDGWEHKYYISDHGRLKSIGGRYKIRHPDGYITIGSIDSTGYRSITLRRPNVCFHARVHALVARHFLHKPIGSECVNHKDGNKLNNHYSNLEWMTMGDNVKHAVTTGLFNIKGTKHHHAKLNEQQVIEMRLLRNQGMTYQKIAEMFGVCRRQASDVVRGINWGWLKDGL